jgi:hypothetical protein
MLVSYASPVIGLLSARVILHGSRTICLYMRRALVLLCLFVFIALPQAFASMAYASPSPFQHVDVAGVSAVAAAPAFAGHCHDASAHAGQPGDSCDAEECDNDPITLYPTLRQGAPFCAIIWQAGPGALAEAGARPAPPPPAAPPPPLTTRQQHPSRLGHQPPGSLILTDFTRLHTWNGYLTRQSGSAC